MPRKTHKPAKQARRRRIAKIDIRPAFKVGDVFKMIPRGKRKAQFFKIIATVGAP